ncbi:MAG TPA: hypothetical protein VNA23_04910 [Anaerolineales bacterium]|nr:hypothetical protein [Anaerolineales bacterium]
MIAQFLDALIERTFTTDPKLPYKMLSLLPTEMKMLHNLPEVMPWYG